MKLSDFDTPSQEVTLMTDAPSGNTAVLWKPFNGDTELLAGFTDAASAARWAKEEGWTIVNAFLL